MKKIKLINKFIIIILYIISIMVIIITYKGIKTNSEINNFINRGEFVFEIDNVKYYKVSRKFDYEDSRKVLNLNNPNFVGTKGDIYLTSRNPVAGSLILKKLSDLIWIGHAGMVINDDATKTIETTGNDVNNQNYVRILDNTWAKDSLENTKEYAVLRVKSITEEDIDKVIETSIRKIGSNYNYLFLLNTKNKYYCTDLISRSYRENNINISNGILATTGSDIILNNNTYLVYYRLRVTEGKSVYYKVYYLE